MKPEESGLLSPGCAGGPQPTCDNSAVPPLQCMDTGTDGVKYGCHLSVLQ